MRQNNANVSTREITTADPKSSAKAIKLSPDQEVARDKLRRFVISGHQEFGLGGAAGTGKTTVLKASLSAAGLEPANLGPIFKALAKFEKPAFQAGCYLAAAYTRKAASNMILRGVPGARTLHSICCNPLANRTQEEVDLIKTLEAERDGINAILETLKEGETPPGEVIKRLIEIDEQLEKLEAPDFEFSPEILDAVEYIVIDEASMVPFKFIEYIRSTRIKIIRVGDPFQLPPIEKGRAVPRDTFTLDNLDATLLTVHRQAGTGGSDVLEIATALRQGKHLLHGDYGQVKVRPTGCFGDDMRANGGALLRATDYFITDTNECRVKINRMVRRHIFNLTGRADDWQIRKGEKITIRKNNGENNLSNGDVIRVNKFEFDQELNCYRIDAYTVLETDQYREKPIWIYTNLLTKAYKDFKAIPLTARTFIAAKKGITIIPADYGYAITGHSAQGTERNVVTIYATLSKTKDDKSRMRWAYTAVTRAKEFAYIYMPQLRGIKEWESL